MSFDQFTRPLAEPSSPEFSTLRIWIVTGLSRETPQLDINAWPVHVFFREKYSGPRWFTSEPEAVEWMNRLREAPHFRSLAPFARLEVRREFTIQCPYCNISMPLYGNGHMVRRRPGRIVKSTQACPDCFAREFPEEAA